MPNRDVRGCRMSTTDVSTAAYMSTATAMSATTVSTTAAAVSCGSVCGK
jgi:hypothetical protein